MSEKDPLSLALTSPDPAIRAIAQRRQAIEEEAGKIDTFITNYATLRPDGVTPLRVVPSVMEAPTPRLVGDFIAMARATLREAGRPLSLNEFYRAFWRRVPEQTPTTKDSFRQKLYQVRKHIAHAEGTKGYWIVGETVPEERREAANGL